MTSESPETESVGAEESPAPEVPIPLAALDQALTPLRRVVYWAAADLGERVNGVRYFESNASRWMGSAKSLGLPDPIRELIETLDEHLVGFDAAELIDRKARLAGLHSSMRRIDTLLGLPLKHKPPKRVRRDPPPREPRAGKGKRDGHSKPRNDRHRAPPPPFRYWDGSLDTMLADLPGTSPVVADALSNVGIDTSLDLLLLRPQGSVTVSPVQGAGRKFEAGRVAMSGRVVSRSTNCRADGSLQGTIRLVGAGLATVKLDGAGHLEPLSPGSKATFVGEWDPESGVLSKSEAVPTPANNEVHLNEYGVSGVGDGDVRALLTRMLPHLATIRDPLPGAVATRMGQIGLRDALVQLHSGTAKGDKARLRLGFDEALYAHIGLGWSRYHRSRDRGIPVGVLHGLAGRLEERTSFHLTDEQQIALEDVKRDLMSSTPMCRVLTGEVGVGKGTVALQAAVSVAENKGQVLMLSPDNASASQRFVFAAPLLREAGLVGRLVEGDISDAMRDALSRGEVHILFGSLELLGQNIECRRLGLVIAEERGDWGSALRAIEKLRSPRPHALVVTSTPVGAAVSMTAYGTTDWTVLASGGRKRVSVTVHAAAERKEAYARAADVVASGQQAVVAFPLINGQDALSLRDAMSVVRALEAEHFEGSRVGLFHGAMSREDRRRAYADLEEKRLAVLVATTSIEDAPPLPSISVVLVEQADRVELGRLQRIGGFIAGSSGDPEAILVVGESDSGFEERFAYVERASDGFAINDAIIADDLIGNIAEGSSPIPTFQFLDPTQDRDLIWKARGLAHELLAANPDLRNGWATDVGRWVRDRWRHLWPNAGEDWVCPVQEGGGQGRKRRRRRRRKR